MRVTKCFLMSLITLICCDAGSLPCKDCALRKTDLPVEQLKLLRHEYIKDQILKKLHLTEAPKVTLPKPPLDSLRAIAEMTQNETAPEPEIELKTESIIIYPKNESLSCLKKESPFCNRLEFDIPDHVRLDNYLSAEVYIHTNDPDVFRVYQILQEDTTNYYELNNLVTEKTSWVKYNALAEGIWSINGSDNVLVIEVIEDKPGADIVRDMNEIPFLIIRIQVGDEKVGSKQKRSITCGENSLSCCKENFYLNFREIGWDNWILHPDGYQANFCRGRCFNDLSTMHFYHSTVLLSFIHDNKDIAEEIGLSMCCTPSKMAPLMIFYRNEEGLIFQKRIDNMRVEACDCA